MSAAVFVPFATVWHRSEGTPREMALKGLESFALRRWWRRVTCGSGGKSRILLHACNEVPKGVVGLVHIVEV